MSNSRLLQYLASRLSADADAANADASFRATFATDAALLTHVAVLTDVDGTKFVPKGADPVPAGAPTYHGHCHLPHADTRFRQRNLNESWSTYRAAYAAHKGGA